MCYFTTYTLCTSWQKRSHYTRKIKTKTLPTLNKIWGLYLHEYICTWVHMYMEWRTPDTHPRACIHHTCIHHTCVRVRTPNITFRHLPPNSTRTGPAAEGTLFSSAHSFPLTLSAPSAKFWYWTDCWSNTASEHACKHEVLPPQVEKKSSISIQMTWVLFECVSNVGGYKRNTRQNLSWRLQTHHHLIINNNKKVFWDVWCDVIN